MSLITWCKGPFTVLSVQSKRMTSWWLLDFEVIASLSVTFMVKPYYIYGYSFYYIYGQILMHLWLVDVLHLWLKVVTFMVSITFIFNFYYIYGWYYTYGFYCIYG